MSKAAVSIVIPCFNQGIYLPDAVESAQRCAPGLCEIIIVNDGSDDPETRRVIEGFSKKGIHVLNQKNQGLASARNNGIRASSGRYILPLDSDNKIRPDFVERAAALLDREPKAAAVYGDVNFFEERTGVLELPPFDLTQTLVSNYIDACAVIRRTVWEICGGYDAAMPYQGMEDWDLWLSVAERGWKIEHLPGVSFDYRIRSNSMLAGLKKDPEKFKRNVSYMFQKHHLLIQEQLERFHRAEKKRKAESSDLSARVIRKIKNIFGEKTK